MFRRPRPEEIEEERPSFSKGERAGSAVAHAAPLLVGLPLYPILVDVGLCLLPAPIVAYVISRSFRRRQSAWGAFQGMQATLVHLILVALVFGALLTGASRVPESPPLDGGGAAETAQLAEDLDPDETPQLAGGAGSEPAVPAQVTLVLFVCAFLLFLYILWGAWDCAFGYDFRYIFISNLVDRITDANLRRQELRRARQEGDRPPNPPRQ